jgi:ubiquinone/menaquinone biosynthesis C-methylase UbiE
MDGFLNPNEVLNQIELRENMIAADFGCGSGGWVIPLAKRLKEGRVYAIDILEEPLSALKNKASLEQVTNIDTIRANIEGEKGVKVPDSICDLVLMTNLLFQVEDKQKALSEAKRVLRPEGKVLVVDWKPESSLGPKGGRVSPEEVKKLAGSLGLKPGKEFSAGTYHWGLVLLK